MFTPTKIMVYKIIHCIYRKTKRSYYLIEFMILLIGWLFESIDGFLKFVNHFLSVSIHIIFWLHHINYFINVVIKKHSFYIHLINSRLKCAKCHNSPKGVLRRTRIESIDVFPLSEVF